VIVDGRVLVHDHALTELTGLELGDVLADARREAGRVSARV
jgi:hypothetical protein